MPEFNYEAGAFFLALLTLLFTGVYRMIGWGVKVNRELAATKLKLERCESNYENLKLELGKVNDSVMSFAVEAYTRNSQIINELKEGNTND